MPRRLRFGWFIPTYGDMERYDDPSTFTPPSLDLFVQIARAAEDYGFEYALVPVGQGCWEAWVSCSMVAAHTRRLKPLIAVRSGYVLPTVMAKMVTTFDQLTGGRLCLNLIAGPGGAESAAEGIHYSHDERYEVMDETVTLMKRLWTEESPVTHDGRYFRVENAVLDPRPYQKPYPRFYIGGISPSAKHVGAKHADCYFFWGDTPARVSEETIAIRGLAANYGRKNELDFGMRLLVVVREREEDAWEAAWNIISVASDQYKDALQKDWLESQAFSRQKELAQTKDYRIAPHLWSGIATVRAGVGTAVVGNPEQVAETLQEFVDAGCTEFCLSGYPNLPELDRFGRLVMPFFRDALVSEAGLNGSGMQSN